MIHGSETLESRMMRKYQVRFGGGRMEKGRSRSPYGPKYPDASRYLASRLPNYVPSQNSVLCKLSMRLPDGSTVTKVDAGGYAGMADQGDDDKSGFSDSFKRTCAKFGIARYLYRDGVPQFVREREPNIESAPEPEVHGNGNGNGNGKAHASVTVPQASRRAEGNVPRSGKALFAWTKDMEARHEVGLLKYLNGWAKLQEFPSRMIDWDADQVALAHHEATRKIQSIQPSRNEALEEAMAN